MLTLENISLKPFIQSTTLDFFKFFHGHFLIPLSVSSNQCCASDFYHRKIDFMPVLIFFTAIWYLSLFSQTFFQHRYAAHGAFNMNKGWERFFFIVAYLTQGSSYMSPRAYAIMHRMHHAYTDTEKDPHSPSFSSNIFSMMWRSRNFYQDIIKGRMKIEPRFVKNLPEWKAFDRLTTGFGSKLIWISLYSSFFIYFSTSPWQYLLLPIIIIMGAFHGAIINWFAHKYGYINFKLRNTSMNLLFVDILMLGESYHNNHHKNPSGANFGRRWHEVDPVYPLIRFLNWAGIIKLNKLVLVESEIEAVKKNH